MTEKKNKKIRGIIFGVELVLALLLLAYLIYGLVSGNSNKIIFYALAITLVVSAMVLNNIVEPYLTGRIAQMDEFQKSAYKQYVLWDTASWAGLLMFVLTIGNSDTTVLIISVGLYVLGTQKKKMLRPAYLGEYTREDVEAAKKETVDTEEITEE